MVLTVLMEKMENQAFQVEMVHQVYPVKMEFQDTMVQQVAKESEELQVVLDIPAHQVKTELMDTQEPREIGVLPDLEDLRVLLG